MARMTRELRDGDSGLGTDFLGPAGRCVEVTEPQSQAGRLLVLHFMETGSVFFEVMQLGRAARFKAVKGPEQMRNGGQRAEGGLEVPGGKDPLCSEGRPTCCLTVLEEAPA